MAVFQVQEQINRRLPESQLPILRMKAVTKKFSGVKVLQNVNIELYKGEVHALMGRMVQENLL